MTVDAYAALPYRTIVRADQIEGHACFTAYHPELPGCMAYGMDWREAVENLKGARRQYILWSLEAGLEVPVPAPLQAWEWRQQ